MQIDVTLQNNGACEPQTFRNDYFTPSFVVHYFDSLINSLRVQRHPIAFCSEITDIYLIIGKNGTLYGGHVTLFVIGFVLDYIVNSTRQSVQFFIFSKEYERIADRITKETHRGVTVLDGIGWYSKHNVKVLVVLAYKRQSVEIFRMVKDIDPNAFISQSSVIGVYGEGFDRLKVK